jgi:hypothetical protein
MREARPGRFMAGERIQKEQEIAPESVFEDRKDAFYRLPFLAVK